MAVVKFGRHGKRPFGLGVKVALVVILGLCFIVAWSLFSSPSSLVSSQRSSFGDISAPVYVGKKGRDHQAVVGSGAQSGKGERVGKEKRSAHKVSKDGKGITHGRGSQKKDGGRVTKHHEEAIHQRKEGIDLKQEVIAKKTTNETETAEVESKKESEREGSAEDGGDEDVEIDGETVEDLAGKESPEEKMEDENNGLKTKGKTKKTAGSLFDSRVHYTWKSCNVRSKYNYIPCIDIERATGKQQSYRHGERSCPRTPPMCLVPLPAGYASPVHWPESKMKVYTSGEWLFYFEKLSTMWNMMLVCSLYDFVVCRYCIGMWLIQNWLHSLDHTVG